MPLFYTSRKGFLLVDALVALDDRDAAVVQEIIRTTEA